MDTTQTPIHYDYFQGWKYINAIFNVFQKKTISYRNSHIAPRYIYRGISKRFFTESKKINGLIENINATESLLKEDYKYIDLSNLKTYIEIKDALQFNNETIPLFTTQPTDKCIELKKLSPLDIYDYLYSELLSNHQYNIEGTIQNGPELDDYSFIEEFENDIIYEYIKPEQIRSGASVRLRDTEKNYTVIADYISYIKNLISGFKTVNPEYKKFDDLEILAEIQHRGGASCLVDFSNNFLISLWFAVNSHMEDMGYLFCYDVNCDAFLHNKLTYLNRHKWNKEIEELLNYSRKSTTYLDDEFHRFWLWRPSNINGRIARQDSVFVFGIEKFIITKHSMDIIPIPKQWKKQIKNALNVFFGITEESVFPDIDGYATSHSKTAPLNENTLYINPNINVWSLQDKYPYKLSFVQKGMSNLLKGEYKIALDYFQKAENISKQSFEEIDKLEDKNERKSLLRIKVEILYSIGFCFNKLNNPNAAISYLEKAIQTAVEIISGNRVTSFTQITRFKNDLNKTLSNLLPKNNQPSSNLKTENKNNIHWFTLEKFQKIIDEYIDTLYDAKNYNKARSCVKFLLQIEIYEKNKQVLINVYNSLLILENLWMGNCKGKRISLTNDNKPTQESTVNFCGLINSYHNLIWLFIKKYQKEKKASKLLSDPEIIQEVKTFKDCLKTYDKPEITNFTLNWHFQDIEENMKHFFKDYPELLQYILGLTNELKGLQQSIQSSRIV